MSQWYEELFTNYARTYDNEVYVHGTLGEADFIENEIEHNKKKAILDIGCGTGRHAIELARRGYTVTGIDLSEAQLARAREKAAAAKVNVEFIQKDARDFKFTEGFDLAIMLCEGGFSLMETDAMNFRILENAAAALKPGGTFIFTCLNALYPLVRQRHQSQDTQESILPDLSGFDLLTLRYDTTDTFRDDDGKEMTLHYNERFYTPPEITWHLQSLGFANIAIHGCKLGAFSRNDVLTFDDFEMLVIAEKKA